MSRVNKLFALLIVLIGGFTAPLAYGQQRIVNGDIYNEDGSAAMPGTNVILKGTKFGTVTDANGKFKISVPASGPATLQVSFIGLKTQEIDVSDASYIKVQLVTDKNFQGQKSTFLKVLEKVGLVVLDVAVEVGVATLNELAKENAVTMVRKTGEDCIWEKSPVYNVSLKVCRDAPDGDRFFQFYNSYSYDVWIWFEFIFTDGSTREGGFTLDHNAQTTDGKIEMPKLDGKRIQSWGISEIKKRENGSWVRFGGAPKK